MSGGADGFSEGSDLVGVGIVFQPTEDGTLYKPTPKRRVPASSLGASGATGAAEMTMLYARLR